MKLTIILFAAGLLCCFSGSAIAQTSIMNAPSSDVVAPRRVYVEMDFITNYAWQRDDTRFANYLPRAVVGVGHNIEVGANLSYTHTPNGGAPLEIQPNAKWQFYRNEGAGVAASVGCLWFVPLTHRTGTDTFGQCYSVVSKRFQGNYGPKFTGGAYGLVGASDDQGTKAGVIAAWEQPVTNRLSFIVDWQSGYNRLGYLSPALNLTLPRNGSLSGGYSIANRGHQNNSLFLYYGQQF
jgi:hypothetical protein